MVVTQELWRDSCAKPSGCLYDPRPRPIDISCRLWTFVFVDRRVNLLRLIGHYDHHVCTPHAVFRFQCSALLLAQPTKQRLVTYRCQQRFDTHAIKRESLIRFSDSFLNIIRIQQTNEFISSLADIAAISAFTSCASATNLAMCAEVHGTQSYNVPHSTVTPYRSRCGGQHQSRRCP